MCNRGQKVKWVIAIDVALIVFLIVDCIMRYVSVGELIIVLMLMKIWYAIGVCIYIIDKIMD